MNVLTINKLKSEINFSVRHMRISNVKGTFKSFTVNLQAESPADFLTSPIDIEIDVASISTQDLARDQHLISAEFFDADRFPKIYFRKNNFYHTEEDLAVLEGEMTIKNVTRPVTFDVWLKGATVTNCNTKIYHITCSTVINRKDFNLTYNSLIEASGSIIDENIHITVELELNN